MKPFSNAHVKSGCYGSVSEVVRAGLRVLEEQEIKIEALRTALTEGETSGIADYSITEIISELDR